MSAPSYTLPSLSSLPLRPYKSVAGALIFCVLLGPIGLLYASFWGGFVMITIGIFVISSKLKFCTLLVWILSCVWGVSAVESYNKKVYQELLQQHS